MSVLLIMLVLSIAVVMLSERCSAARRTLGVLAGHYDPAICRSFILDLPLLLPFVGIVVEAVSRLTRRAAGMILVALSLSVGIPSAIFGQDWIVMAALVMLLFSISVLREEEMPLRFALYTSATLLFWAISGSLYADRLNLTFLAPYLGHADAWNGNHFMWNSGVELLGLKPLVARAATYEPWRNGWNLFAFLLLTLYPVVMMKAGRRLYGMLFGYTAKQTGVSALFIERKCRS